MNFFNLRPLHGLSLTVAMVIVFADPTMKIASRGYHSSGSTIRTPFNPALDPAIGSPASSLVYEARLHNSYLLVLGNCYSCSLPKLTAFQRQKAASGYNKVICVVEEDGITTEIKAKFKDLIFLPLSMKSTKAINVTFQPRFYRFDDGKLAFKQSDEQSFDAACSLAFRAVKK